ncbi:putative enoyl-CoA hydratase, mitochondrial [Aphanomyces cochlioides]|nr:putative enoyl-CoA hydratase, mitochondrial [Aphanomyces cochlioides]
MQEVGHAAREFDKDANISAIILTGSEKAFAAGADIKEMATREFIEVYNSTMFASWGDITKIQKPVIAAVNGFALGRGCELAMMCDMIIAGDKAKFGQPEIKLGTIPGVGGTQRLIRAIGKSKAMHLVLTGDMIDAHQAERDGLVAKVVPADKLLVSIAILCKILTANLGRNFGDCQQDCVVLATYHPHGQGSCERFVRNEFARISQVRRSFVLQQFATHDQKEGMAAFVEKRAPNFKNN